MTREFRLASQGAQRATRDKASRKALAVSVNYDPGINSSVEK